LIGFAIGVTFLTMMDICLLKSRMDVIELVISLENNAATGRREWIKTQN
jgi:hypothetical protein